MENIKKKEVDVQEIYEFFIGKGWKEEDINEHIVSIASELALFDISLETYYNDVISKCDFEEFVRQGKHVWFHVRHMHEVIEYYKSRKPSIPIIIIGVLVGEILVQFVKSLF